MALCSDLSGTPKHLPHTHSTLYLVLCLEMLQGRVVVLGIDTKVPRQCAYCIPCTYKGVLIYISIVIGMLWLLAVPGAWEYILYSS